MTQASTATEEGSADALAEGAPAAPDDGVAPEADEFDPIGTLALIAVYFAVLAIMWVLMYFVEFAGNGPTVVG